MSLESQNLDDRRFEDLLEQARQVIREKCPSWTDLTPSDPGMVLLEAFAYLTDVLIYRLNRLPDRAFVEFLRLMGVKRQPPAAARVTLTFSRASSRPGVQERIEIPAGTRVTTSGRSAGDPVVFVTAASADLDPESNAVEVPAFHCDEFTEVLGRSAGLAGQSFVVAHPPIIAPTGDNRDLLVGVESTMAEIGRSRSRKVGDKVYRIWRDVSDFVNQESDRRVFTVDRFDGRITFAPSIQAVLRETLDERPEPFAAIPEKDREFRVWYRNGGGAAGNVAAGSLTVLKTVIPGVVVTNASAATGGRDAETLANAIVRGPQEMHSLRRTVTARDFERLATGTGGVARAAAFTKAQVWAHAQAGTVELALVPDVPQHVREQQLRVEDLRASETEPLREHILELFEERRPIGTSVEIHWARYRPVRIRAHITAFHGEDGPALAARIQSRIEQIISPLPTKLQPHGWPFGQPLRADRLYDAILEEPGVKNVERLRMIVATAPRQSVESIAADGRQKRCWHVIADNQLYRSVDNGESWHTPRHPPELQAGEQLRFVRAHPNRAGCVAAVVRRHDQSTAARVFVSADCGESWRAAQATAFDVHDVAWITRNGVPALLIASSRGLFELAVTPRPEMQQLLVGDLPPDLGFWNVEVINDIRGQPAQVAVAAQSNRGVWVSERGGLSTTFDDANLKEDVRVLLFQQEGGRSFLWAGVTVAGNVQGKGCFRWGGRNEGWRHYREGWQGGSCYGMAFAGLRLLASTYDAGVMMLDTDQQDPKWNAPRSDCGLPPRDANHRFQPVVALAGAPDGRCVIAGAETGAYRTLEQGQKWEPVSDTEFAERVSLSDMELFCSGEHEVSVSDEFESESRV